MSSTKVINLGNTCSSFGFIPPNVLPTTGGNYYNWTTFPNIDTYYIMMGSNYYPYVVNMTSACIPAGAPFNYNMFNIGLMWSSSIPAISSNGISYVQGDPRLRILTSYWGETISNNPILNRPSSEWTIVALTNPENPSTSNISVARMPTSLSKTLTATGWDSLSSISSSITNTNASPAPASGSTAQTTYYLTAYSSRAADATTAKNVYNTSMATVDLNTSLTAPTIATITVPALLFNNFTTTTYSSRTHINYTTTVSTGTWSAITFSGKINAMSILTNILVNTFGQAPSTTGVITSGSTFETNVYLQSSLPAADPDPAFTTASENGIIFIPSSPSVTGFTNPVVGFTVTPPTTISAGISSYFSLTPTGSPASYGYLLTYPLSKDTNPTIEAGSDFLLLTPDNAYIVYVNSSGALAIQSSNRLTSPGASPGITYQTFGGYWEARAVAGGSPGARGFQLAYVTPSTSYFMNHPLGGGTVTFSTAAGSTYTCMHCSPAASGYVCQQGV